MAKLKIAVAPGRYVEYGSAVENYGSPQEREAVLPAVMADFRAFAEAYDLPEGAEPEIVEIGSSIPGRRNIGWLYRTED